jgi:hypothetical protein
LGALVEKFHAQLLQRWTGLECVDNGLISELALPFGHIFVRKISLRGGRERQLLQLKLQIRSENVQKVYNEERDEPCELANGNA